MRAEGLAWMVLVHVLAVKLTGQLIPIFEKSTPDSLQSAKIVLDGVAYEIVDSQGLFFLYDISQGLHSLEVFALHQEFDTFLLEVRGDVVFAKTAQSPRRFELESDDILELKSVSLVSPYELRPETSVLRLFLNPMTLMIAVAVFATYFAPKRMMDEEQMLELKQITKEMESKKGQDWMDSLLQMIDPED